MKRISQALALVANLALALRTDLNTAMVEFGSVNANLSQVSPDCLENKPASGTCQIYSEKKWRGEC